MSSHLGAAIRFAVAMLVADLIGLALFGNVGAATYASFATLSALYFLDFDGSWRERVVGYSIATAVGLLGVCLGTALGFNLAVAVIATFVVAFGFAFARVLRGYVARCAIGVQMAFILAILTPGKPDSLGWNLAAWLVGSIVAVVAALTIFPLRHTGNFRRALARWCEGAQSLTDSLGSGDVSGQLEAVETANADLLHQLQGTVIRPGLVSRRMRALSQMQLEATRATTSLQALVDADHRPTHIEPLAAATSAGFRGAANMVLPNGEVSPLAPISDARSIDVDQAVGWTADNLATSGTRAVHELEEHNTLRVLSISADVMQHLAARSQGEKTAQPNLQLPIQQSIADQLRDNLTLKSCWFRNAVRTAVGVSGALLITELLGLNHGIWVAMTVLTLIQVTFTAGSSERSALLTAAGVTAGIGVAGLLIWLAPHWWMMVVLLPILAFCAKWSADQFPLLGQFAYTPFAVVNVAVLSWPQPVGLIVVRFEDVVLALGIGLVATLLVFPRGLSRVLESSWHIAAEAAAACLRASTDLLTARSTAADQAESAARELARATSRYADTIDAAYMEQASEAAELAALAQREAWLLEVLLVTSVFRNFAQADQLPADNSELARALNSGAQRLEAVDRVASAQAASLVKQPRALISATWGAWWLDHLAETEPDRVPRMSQ